MPRKSLKASRPKRIVYLWGAGATQAEISYLGAYPVNLLMRDTEVLGEGVATRIIGKLPKRARAAFATDKGLDIEKLISLLSSCNVARYTSLAGRIRKHYFEDIRDNLARAKVLDEPKLAIGLLRLHDNTQFRAVEELTGIVSTNHDGLVQLASQRVFGGVDIGFQYNSENFSPKDSDLFPVLQLHGSFTWQFGLPIQVSVLTDTAVYGNDTVWIPPTVSKDSKAYPFNKLAAQAYELLARRCDVLRVIGSSLTQNDWNILTMIFNAQRHKELTRGAPFRIELIMPQGAGKGVVEQCSFLRELTPIGFLTDGDFAAYKDETIAMTPEMSNPFAFWMKEKIKHHIRIGELTSASLHDDVKAIAGEVI